MYRCWFCRYCSCISIGKYWSILTYIIHTDIYAFALGLWQFCLLQFRDWYLSFLILNFRYVSSCLPLIWFYASFLANFTLFIFLLTYFPYFILFLFPAYFFIRSFFFLFDFSSIRLLPFLFFLSFCIFLYTNNNGNNIALFELLSVLTVFPLQFNCLYAFGSYECIWVPAYLNFSLKIIDEAFLMPAFNI